MFLKGTHLQHISRPCLKVQRPRQPKVAPTDTGQLRGNAGGDGEEGRFRFDVIGRGLLEQPAPDSAEGLRVGCHEERLQEASHGSILSHSHDLPGPEVIQVWTFSKFDDLF